MFGTRMIAPPSNPATVKHRDMRNCGRDYDFCRADRGEN
jgi:hypothetical protein